MNIGVYVSNRDPSSGGAHSFEHAVLDGLADCSLSHNITVFYQGYLNFRTNHRFTYVRVGFKKTVTVAEKICREIYRFLVKVGLAKDNSLRQRRKDHNIEFLWFATASYEETGLPFAYTVWDVNHRLLPEFLELSEPSEWMRRETHYSCVLSKADLVITGTSLGGSQISNFYSVADNKILVVRFPIPEFQMVDEALYQRFRAEHQISDSFFVYPANFWPHKDHVTVLRAFRKLKDSGTMSQLLLVGSDTGCRSEVIRLVEELDLVKSVKIPGFISKEILGALYRKAESLIYASHCGPDNLPPVEAFSLGCPVICANYEGAEEQLGDAALYFQKGDAEALLQQIRTLQAPEIRKKLIINGFKNIKGWSNKVYVESVISKILPLI